MRLYAYGDLLLCYNNARVLPPDANPSMPRARNRFERILYRVARCPLAINLFGTNATRTDLVQPPLRREDCQVSILWVREFKEPYSNEKRDYLSYDERDIMVLEKESF